MSDNLLQRQAASMATQANREDWKAHGFSHTGVMVHDDDRMLLRAYADLLRVERLTAMVEDGDQKVIEFTAVRNMQKSPTAGEIEAVELLIEKLGSETARKRVRSALHGMRTYLRKYGEAFTHEQANPTSYKCAALRICYGNMAAKLFAYARALVKHKPTGADNV